MLCVFDFFQTHPSAKKQFDAINELINEKNMEIETVHEEKDIAKIKFAKKFLSQL